MSHDPHAPSVAGGGHPPVLPASANITMGVRLLVLAGVLISIMQGSFVVGSSAFGRIWPSLDSTKLPLPPANLGH